MSAADALRSAGASRLGRLLRCPPPELATPGASTPAEVCELCGQALGDDHPHLLDLDSRPESRPELHTVRCVCPACGVLFADGGAGARLRRIPSERRRISDLALDDARWAELAIPVRLAWLVRTHGGGVRAAYPGAMGAAEAVVRPEAWDALAADNPVLAALKPEVEALLVHRLGAAREHWLVPVDDCFRLVALLRARWRGLSGGVEAWDAVRAYFDDLRARSRRVDRHGRPLEEEEP